MAAISPSLGITAPLGRRSIHRRFPLLWGRSVPLRLDFSSRFSTFSANESPEDIYLSSSGGELLHAGCPPPPRAAGGATVFVTLPADAVGPGGRLARRKAMGASFKALELAGVEGVVVELWWGVVEGDAPGVYDWTGYADLVSMAGHHGLKVRAVMAFHQCGLRPGDPCWIPLPWWVLEQMDAEPDLAYSDRNGQRSKEYISLGCDNLPVLKGRSPIQAYSDFMRSFRDRFKDFLGTVITELKIGMGPAGELRYPSCPSEKLKRPSSAPELDKFQCYDKYMLSSLGACAQKEGMHGWGYGGPLDASSFLQNLEETNFFRSGGFWNTDYGKFFLEWYSGMLLLHGERLCIVTKAIFLHTGLKICAKVAGIHGHYHTCSHPSELTAGYYNTLTTNGYLPVAWLFSRYNMFLCCTCFDMQDGEEHSSSTTSPEGFLRLLYAARMHNLSLSCENSTKLDDRSLKQVVKSSKLYSVGAHEASLSFNYVRMDRHLFDPHNWPRFTHFVRQMSDAKTFQAKLDFSGRELYCSSMSATEEIIRSFGYH